MKQTSRYKASCDGKQVGTVWITKNNPEFKEAKVVTSYFEVKNAFGNVGPVLNSTWFDKDASDKEILDFLVQKIIPECKKVSFKSSVV